MVKINKKEYDLMKKYIEDQCGIFLEDGKEYLIESRLSDLVEEIDCKSFADFHQKAKMDIGGKLKDRIIDAMTTNETLWFRDDSLWEYLREVAVPALLDIAASKGKARVWSAAASTGQEAYSLLMLIDEEAKRRGTPSLVNRIEIFASDISSSALFVAISGNYTSLAVKRGLPLDKKNKYFTQKDNVWSFDQELKKRVKFEKFNLQNSFTSLGAFDLILCRYVIIYFSREFKKTLFAKMARALNPKGVYILGASESLWDLSDDFEVVHYKNAVINVKK